MRRLLRIGRFRWKRTRGSHEQWEWYVHGKRRVVTIDHNDAPFTSRTRSLHAMIRQSGLTRRKWIQLLNGEDLDACRWPEEG